MSGIFIETPLKHKTKDLLITPKISFVINSGQSNSNKLSNEVVLSGIFSQHLEFILNLY